MSKLQSAESILENYDLDYQDGRSYSVDETKFAMHTYAKAVADELAKRIKDGELFRAGRANDFEVDHITTELQKELS